MKLTKKQINKISDNYNLGKVKGVKLIDGGNINHNFIVKTEKDTYIVRVLGYKLNEYWNNQKELEFMVLEHLIKNKFPYDIPHFIKNNKGKYVSRVEKKLIEVYPKIKGQSVVNVKENHIKEMAKALAIYHKIISKLKVPTKFKKLDDCDWIEKELGKMKKVDPKNKLDEVMLKHVDTFLDILNNHKGKKLALPLLVGHHDFHRFNLLFNKDKLTGIIDFEDVEYSYRIRDFFLNNKKIELNLLFVKEYNKYNKLGKSEVLSLVDQKLLGNCYSFWWAYKGKMKVEGNRLKKLRHIVRKVKRYEEFDEILRKRVR